MHEIIPSTIGRRANSSPLDIQRLAHPLPEASHLLGISKSTVYRLVNSGKIRMIKVAGRSVIPNSEIRRVASEGSE